mmetsp:Transcript_52359/g.170297  ORF Transcript_52359/g.170297 Transcript_52359/m.170297 type:complete len:134 (-) Transcript_52359:662-1063(-)
MPFTFPTPWQPPVEPGQAFRESCTMQAIVSGVVGGGAGLVLGAVLTPLNSQLQQETEHLPLREQMRRGGREMGSQSRSWGKNLLVIGAVFSVSECFVEKSRGRVCDRPLPPARARPAPVRCLLTLPCAPPPAV